jgi:uncharacterized membrane protein HdeD (DUF308 family)
VDASAQDPARAIARAVGALWWVWLAFGVFWIAVAFVVLQFDQASITTVGVLIGFMFLFAGFQQLFIAIFAEGWPRWVLMIFGVLLLIAAVLSFVEPKNTFAGVADILGFIFLLIGVFWTIEALAERAMNPLWWISLIAGIWALFHGVTDIIRAFQIRAFAKALEQAAP